MFTTPAVPPREGRRERSYLGCACFPPPSSNRSPLRASATSAESHLHRSWEIASSHVKPCSSGGARRNVAGTRAGVILCHAGGGRISLYKRSHLCLRLSSSCHVTRGATTPPMAASHPPAPRGSTDPTNRWRGRSSGSQRPWQDRGTRGCLPLPWPTRQALPTWPARSVWPTWPPGKHGQRGRHHLVRRFKAPLTKSPGGSRRGSERPSLCHHASCALRPWWAHPRSLAASWARLRRPCCQLKAHVRTDERKRVCLLEVGETWTLGQT